MRVLVTGGAGFVGSHLCEKLLHMGEEVICLDNFVTGNRRNIDHLSKFPGFRILEHDIIVPLYVEVDRIFNLACPASPAHYQIDPIRTMETSIYGAINMLGLAKKLRARILQASSSEVYGEPEIHPQVEAYWGHVNPIGQRSCYQEGKRCAETLFFDFHRQHEVEIKVVRIFNTYGPRMHPNDGRVVSNFVVQAIRGDDITIHGDGSQTRSLCYVDDLVSGLLQVMETAGSFTGPINLGSLWEISMLDLAEKVLRLTGSSSRIVFRALPEGDPKRRRPDISLANAILGWQPSTSIDEGLIKTIQYFKEL